MALPYPHPEADLDRSLRDWHPYSHRHYCGVCRALRIFLAILLLAGALHASPAEEAVLWKDAKTNPKDSVLLDKLVGRYLRTKKVYDEIQAMRPNGVPSRIAFCLLYRECDNDMSCSPAQGDPLTHKSRHVPKGRIPGVSPAYTFLQAAEDAYYSKDLDYLQAKDWSTIGSTLWVCEGFNGTGYWKRGLVSPYIWSGTSNYLRGKYTGDNRYNPKAVDQQMGVAALLLRMQLRGVTPPVM